MKDKFIEGDYSVEGSKNRRKLTEDCRAVSELIGQVLMIAIVVLVFSSISLAVFSDGGAMNPPHTPRTDLQESIDTGTGTVQISHSGGEAIDLKYIKITLNDVEGRQAEFNMSDPAVEVFDPQGNKLSSDNVFTLGDCIVINASSSNVNITNGANLYFIYTESSQVIQKAIL